MNVLITGANGFVGKYLVSRLLAEGIDGQPLQTLCVLDVAFQPPIVDQRIRQYRGSIADGELLDQVFEQPYDLIFHLASIPGGAAEKYVELGLDVNLKGTLALLERCRHQDKAPILVFSSTIAVYGGMPEVVDDTTPFLPTLSYGAQKLASEILVKDYSRRGWVDGRILRLPGIVARPAGPSGLLSAFMSNVFWRLSAGEKFVSPVSANAVSWWMSVRCCVTNLIHAAMLAPEKMTARRDFTLPVLRLTMGELVDGIVATYGQDRHALVSYEPDQELEAAFGRQPPLVAHAAEAIGFCHDGSVAQLIHNALHPEENE